MERGVGSNTKVLKMMNLIPKRKPKIKYKLDSSDSSVGDSDQSSSSLTNRNRHEPLEQRKFCAGRKSMYEKYWKTQKLPDEQQEPKKPTLYASTPMIKRKPALFTSPNVTPIVNLKPPTNDISPGKESASVEFVKSASSEIPLDNSAQKSDLIPETNVSSKKSPIKRPLRNNVENVENIEPNCDTNAPQCVKCGVEKRSFGFNTTKTKNQSIGVCTSPLPAIPAPICHSVQVGTSAVMNNSVGINTSCPKKQSIATNTSRHMKSVGTNTTNVAVAKSPDLEVTYNSHNYESFSRKPKSASQRDKAHDSSKSNERAREAASKILNVSGKGQEELGECLIKQTDNSTAALGKFITQNKEVLENVVNDILEHSIPNISGRLTRSRTQNLSLKKADCITEEADILKPTSPGRMNRSRTRNLSLKNADCTTEDANNLEPNSSGRLNRSRTRNRSLKNADCTTEDANNLEPNKSVWLNRSRTQNLSLKKADNKTEEADILKPTSPGRMNRSRTQNLSLKNADCTTEDANNFEPNSSGTRNRSRTRNLSLKNTDSITEVADILEPNRSIRLNGSRTRNLSSKKADSTNQKEQNSSFTSTSRRKNEEDPNDLQTAEKAPDIEPPITPMVDENTEQANDAQIPEATHDTSLPAPEKLESGKNQAIAVENDTNSPLTTKKSKRKGAANVVHILQSLHFVPEPVAKKLEVIVEDVEADCVPVAEDSKTGKETTRPTRKRGRKAMADVKAAKDASVRAEPVPSTSTATRSKRGKKSKDLHDTSSDSKLHKVSSSSSFKSRSSARSKRRRTVEMDNESYLNFKGMTTRCGRQVKPTIDPALEKIAALVYKGKRDKRRPPSVKRKNHRQDHMQTSQSKERESTDATTKRQSQDSGCFLKEDESATMVQSKNVASGADFPFVKPTGVPKRLASKKNEIANDRASTSIVDTPSDCLTSEAPTVANVSRRRTNKINFPIRGTIMDAEFFSEEPPVQSDDPVRTCCILKSPFCETYDLSIKPKHFFDYTIASANTIYSLVRGEAEVRVHDSRQHLNEGDWFEVPKGIEYFVKNAGDETMHMHFYSKN